MINRIKKSYQPMPWIMTEKSAIFHTVLSAYLSIIAGLIEAGLSLYSGHAEISMSLYGIALMAIVDITGSVLVLKMWQCGSISDERLISERRQEMYYSIVIGTLMVVLGFFLIVDSLKNFTSKESPDDQSWIGTVVTIFGSICGLSLAAYKYAVGVALDSPVVIADSVSSLCSGLTSLTALVVVLIDDRLWWSDSSAGFTAALYTLYSGCSTVLNARAEIRSLENGTLKSHYSRNEKSSYQGSDCAKVIEIRESSVRDDEFHPVRSKGLCERMNIFSNSSYNSDEDSGDRTPLVVGAGSEEDTTFSA